MMEKKGIGNRELVLLILIAYVFSFAVRMIWVYQFHDNPNFYWNGQLMINTNDGYFFASGAQRELFGMHLDNPRIPDMWSFGTVALTVLLAKITPFSLETIILYMPAIISSLVVIPIILIARLFNGAVWGFFAALLGAVTWSYYNRTMVGYYDTDMFSAMAPMFILYFLMKSVIDFNLRSALYAALAIAIYPFLYDGGASIVNAMGILYALYLLFYHRNEQTAYYSIMLVFLALVPFPLSDPYSYLMKIVVLVAAYKVLEKVTIPRIQSFIVIGVLFLLFMYFGNVFGLIISKIAYYTSTGTSHTGLHFYSVTQTIREAGKIPFTTFANRISGSSIGLLLALAGYAVLVWRHRPSILALPLVGIGIFALWGGLRFTVYAVPVAAMSAIYLFHTVVTLISDKKSIYALTMSVMTASMLYPNITHILGYKVPTVMNASEVSDLDRLNKIADTKDYTIAWWDYGYPIWFYSDTNTIIDGGKHDNDNFIVSTIMQTTSPALAANLSRVAVETYVGSHYATIADTLFHNGQKNQLDPNMLLSKMESDTFQVPAKTRDVYLYMPYRMLNIFPTVMVFGNLDLTTGQAKRKTAFYPTRAVRNNDKVVEFSNGIVFDIQKGELHLGKERVPVRAFVVTQLTKEGKNESQQQTYGNAHGWIVLYLKSYGRFVVMDEQTYHSMYVQMFLLGNYDKNLFELVVSSPYSKIYRLKK